VRKNMTWGLIRQLIILLPVFCWSVEIFAANADGDSDEQATAKSNSSDPNNPHQHHQNLAEQATNPTAMLMSFRLQEAYTPSYTNADSDGNVVTFQAVVPTKLPWKSVPAVINRWTMPYVSTPEVNGETSGSGMGDSFFNNFFNTTWLPKGHMFAFGPTWVIPTAGDNEKTGSGQWSVGPSAVYINTKTPSVQWGLLVYQVWDFAKARSDAQDVSTLYVQPVFTKHFSRGWYVSTPDAPQSYNFETDAWSLNIGGRLGKVTKFGGQPVDLWGGVYANPIDKDNTVSGRWTFKLNIAFLLPE
jgi:hypothetical protein